MAKRKKRKMNIPIDKQILGLTRALRNPRTPKQLRPSLQKRLKNLIRKG